MWYKFIPVSDKIPQLLNFDAITIGCIVLIKKSYKDDVTLQQHELVHVKQFYNLPIINGILYILWPTYRLKAECEAYSVNVVKKGLWSLPIYAKFIHENYFLKLFFSLNDVTEQLKLEYKKAIQ